MKRRKGNKILNARKLESIADKALRSKYSYNKFKNYIFDLIYEEALKGKYHLIIDITDFNQEYYKRIEDELKKENYTVDLDYYSGEFKIIISWVCECNNVVTSYIPKKSSVELIRKLTDELDLLIEDEIIRNNDTDWDY